MRFIFQTVQEEKAFSFVWVMVRIFCGDGGLVQFCIVRTTVDQAEKSPIDSVWNWQSRMSRNGACSVDSDSEKMPRPCTDEKGPPITRQLQNSTFQILFISVFERVKNTSREQMLHGCVGANKTGIS